MFGLFVQLFKFRVHGFRIQVSGFRKRAVNHSLITRKLILCHKRSKNAHNSKGTPPCTFKQPWVHASIAKYSQVQQCLTKFGCVQQNLAQFRQVYQSQAKFSQGKLTVEKMKSKHFLSSIESFKVEKRTSKMSKE